MSEVTASNLHNKKWLKVFKWKEKISHRNSDLNKQMKSTEMGKNCQADSNIYMKCWGPRMSKPILEKKRTKLGDLYYLISRLINL